MQTSHLDILHGIVHYIEQFCQLFPPLMFLVTPFLSIYTHAGVKHPSIVCDACRENGITGIRWKCVRCYDFDLCNICYNVGKHSLEHEFSRIDVLEGPRYMLHACVLLLGWTWASPTLAGLHCGSVFSCLRPYTIILKLAYSNILWRSISCTKAYYEGYWAELPECSVGDPELLWVTASYMRGPCSGLVWPWLQLKTDCPWMKS